MLWVGVENYCQAPSFPKVRDRSRRGGGRSLPLWKFS